MALDLRPVRSALGVRVSGACPMCDQESWLGGDRLLGLADLDDTGRPDGVMIEVLPFVCTNCGFVRLHAIQPLETIDD